MLVAVPAPATSAPGEPLIVTILENPDPGLVAAPQPRLKLTMLGGSDDQASAVDQAIESFGRAIGEAAAADRQAIEAKCRSSRPTAENTLDRFAWAANCRYARH